MENPWHTIELSSYEKHMKSEGLTQLQTLSQIAKEQLSYSAEYVTILGIVGGNGIEHIDISIVKKVYGIDINQKYLEQCNDRYSYLGNQLETICCDLSQQNAILPKCNLLICNLIIEYLGLETFCNLLKRNIANLDIISCVIQKNNENSFVSLSESSKQLEKLDMLHQDICKNKLITELAKLGIPVIFEKAINCQIIKNL